MKRNSQIIKAYHSIRHPGGILQVRLSLKMLIFDVYLFVNDILKSIDSDLLSFIFIFNLELNICASINVKLLKRMCIEITSVNSAYVWYV